MRYLGIDYGSKRVGLALSDEAGRMGFPHTILANTPALVAEVAALIEQENVGAVVIGESKDFSGTDNPIASAAKEFGNAVARLSRKPIYFEPEYLTSAQARRTHDPSEKTRAPKHQMHLDASAAALILTNFLSHHEAQN